MMLRDLYLLILLLLFLLPESFFRSLLLDKVPILVFDTGDCRPSADVSDVYGGRGWGVFRKNRLPLGKLVNPSTGKFILLH